MENMNCTYKNLGTSGKAAVPKMHNQGVQSMPDYRKPVTLHYAKGETQYGTVNTAYPDSVNGIHAPSMLTRNCSGNV